MPDRNIIGIISDTHDNRNNIKKAVEIFNNRETALVIHAGDCISPFTVLDFKNLNCPMEMVFGNNDGERIGLFNAYKELGRIMSGPRSFEFNGKQFIVMHEEGCLEEMKQMVGIDVIVYGHTHEVDIRPGRPMIINPGEAGGWLKGRSTIVILDISKMQAELIELQDTCKG